MPESNRSMPSNGSSVVCLTKPVSMSSLEGEGSGPRASKRSRTTSQQLQEKSSSKQSSADNLGLREPKVMCLKKQRRELSTSPKFVQDDDASLSEDLDLENDLRVMSQLTQGIVSLSQINRTLMMDNLECKKIIDDLKEDRAQQLHDLQRITDERMKHVLHAWEELGSNPDPVTSLQEILQELAEIQSSRRFLEAIST